MKVKRPSVLISIDWFLPGTKSGGPVRSYSNLIDHLSSEIDFYVFTRNTDYCEMTPYEGIESDQWVDLKPGLKVYYLSADRTNRSGISKVLKSRYFDFILINGIYSWNFSILPLLILKKHPNVIVSARGMLNDQAFSVKPFKKKLFLMAAKVFGLYNNAVLHATNEIEAERVRQWIGKDVRVKIAPNLARKIEKQFHYKGLEAPVKMVNVARIAKEKGTLRMLKAISKIKYALHLDIYGSIYDHEYWAQCLDIIKGTPAHINIQYKGIADSERIPDIMSAYNFFIMLSEGENFGHAILEALSVGLPVVISNKTPWQNLEDKKVGWDLDIDKEETIVGVLEEITQITPSKYEKLSKNAFILANEFINDISVIDANKNLFLP